MPHRASSYIQHLVSLAEPFDSLPEAVVDYTQSDFSFKRATTPNYSPRPTTTTATPPLAPTLPPPSRGPDLGPDFYLRLCTRHLGNFLCVMESAFARTGLGRMTATHHRVEEGAFYEIPDRDALGRHKIIAVVYKRTIAEVPNPTLPYLPAFQRLSSMVDDDTSGQGASRPDPALTPTTATTKKSFSLRSKNSVTPANVSAVAAGPAAAQGTPFTTGVFWLIVGKAAIRDTGKGYVLEGACVQEYALCPSYTAPPAQGPSSHSYVASSRLEWRETGSTLLPFSSDEQVYIGRTGLAWSRQTLSLKPDESTKCIFAMRSLDPTCPSISMDYVGQGSYNLQGLPVVNQQLPKDRQGFFPIGPQYGGVYVPPPIESVFHAKPTSQPKPTAHRKLASKDPPSRPSTTGSISRANTTTTSSASSDISTSSSSCSSNASTTTTGSPSLLASLIRRRSSKGRAPPTPCQFPGCKAIITTYKSSQQHLKDSHKDATLQCREAPCEVLQPTPAGAASGGHCAARIKKQTLIRRRPSSNTSRRNRSSYMDLIIFTESLYVTIDDDHTKR
ncbi:hypothetical protein BGX29_004898 [Mortierella sp. GBA35]|nr:hypothetical protein BGX29_004898 [Mortierella sp. GBA35]